VLVRKMKTSRPGIFIINRASDCDVDLKDSIPKGLSPQERHWSRSPTIPPMTPLAVGAIRASPTISLEAGCDYVPKKTAFGAYNAATVLIGSVAKRFENGRVEAKTEANSKRAST
jgi:hypothetical protein